jgi:hypothetical protein
MTAHQLGTVLFGALAVILIATLGVMQRDVSTLRAAALIAGLTYVHYFIGTAIEAGVVQGKFYEAVYTGLCLLIIATWMMALVFSWW